MPARAVQDAPREFIRGNPPSTSFSRIAEFQGVPQHGRDHILGHARLLLCIHGTTKQKPLLNIYVVKHAAVYRYISNAGVVWGCTPESSTVESITPAK